MELLKKYPKDTLSVGQSCRTEGWTSVGTTRCITRDKDLPHFD